MMRRFVVAVALASWPNSSLAQNLPARAADYLFLTNASDARALWVNPAGLAVVAEAALLAEFSIERNGSDLRVEQYTLGLSSRGIAISYLRNRPAGESAVGTLRAGTAVPFQRGAVGAAITRYSQDSISSRGADVGLIYFPNAAVQLGLAVRHIGRPTVGGRKIPVTTVAAVQWTVARLQLSWEAQATEERAIGESGFDLSYRAGGRVALVSGLPVVVIGVIDIGSNWRIDRFNVGFSVGGDRSVTTVSSAVSRDNSPVFERFSAALVATNTLTAR